MDARMTKDAAKLVAAGTGALALAASGLAATAAVAAPAQAAGQQTQAPQAEVAEQAVQAPGLAAQELDAVEGTFSFTQGALTPTTQVRRAFSDAARYLCASEYAPGAEDADALAWQLTVTSDAGGTLTATLGELAEDGAATVTMGCSCSGNPAGGRASANVEVTGVTLQHLMEAAGVSEQANTVTFTCSDGYEVSLPLAYVTQRHTLIAFSANGQALSDSLGGTNQLWVGSTSARHFARDVVAVTFEARDAADVPAVPGARAKAEGVNLPNASVSAVAQGSPVIPRVWGRAGVPLTVSGTAYDFRHRVCAVEFSLNGGRTWTRHETPGTNDYQIVSWELTWTPPAPGGYELLVRAVSEGGRVGPQPDSVELCIA